MTIQQLLEAQNMASSCIEKVYYVNANVQEAGSANAITVSKKFIDYTETVCYQPIIGYTFILSIPIIFAYSAYLVYCWFNPSHKNK